MSYSLEHLQLGPIEANCYVVTDNETKEIIVIDPGAYDQKLKDLLKGRLNKVKYILITHRHYDHLLGAAPLKEDTNAEVAIHEADALALSSFEISRSLIHGVKQTPIHADILLKDKDVIKFGNAEIKVIHTPGHSAGGVCYLLDDMLFSGDTLFAGTMGRTDLPTSDRKTLINSLKSLSVLQFNGTVYPGHGEFTTLEKEKEWMSSPLLGIR